MGTSRDSPTLIFILIEMSIVLSTWNTGLYAVAQESIEGVMIHRVLDLICNVIHILCVVLIPKHI